MAVGSVYVSSARDIMRTFTCEVQFGWAEKRDPYHMNRCTPAGLINTGQMTSGRIRIRSISRRRNEHTARGHVLFPNNCTYLTIIRKPVASQCRVCVCLYVVVNAGWDLDLTANALLMFEFWRAMRGWKATISDEGKYRTSNVTPD